MTRNSNKRKKKGKSQPDSHRSTSTLAQHTKVGKSLVPPLAQTFTHLSSWINERLPDMLWAALLFTSGNRPGAIEWIRELATVRVQHAPDSFPPDFTVTELGRGTAEAIKLLSLLCEPEPVRSALRPILLLDDLPGVETWRAAIGVSPSEEDWARLREAVALTLNHQSEASTDCRWAYIVYMLGKGRIRFTEQTKHIPSMIAMYPYLEGEGGAQTRIRSVEVGMAPLFQKKTDWPSRFWKECESRTTCLPLVLRRTSTINIGTTRGNIEDVRRHLVDHCGASRRTTALDPKHDTIFGTALYVLALVEELLGISSATSIGSRLIVRTILECSISLAYLLKADSPEEWQKHRAFGAGQAKLALLKIEDLKSKPSSIDEEQLRALANEDVWQEFVDIDLGHWTGMNLRQMAMQADVKQDYDAYYGWGSVYAHGHWSAIRDSMFDVCGNPLHRLHRIPRHTPRELPDVVDDAVKLADKTFELVDKAFPEFKTRLRSPA